MREQATIFARKVPLPYLLILYSSTISDRNPIGYITNKKGSIRMNLFGTRYKDDEIVLRAEHAIAEDSILNIMTRTDVSSQDGVVTIQGKAASEREQRHIEDVVRHALDGAGLAYEQIDNRIVLT
jgi:osmotically-inducible protein OsmY